MLNIEKGEIELTNECNINYEDHKYRKKEIIWYKIKNNLATEEDMKEIEYQKMIYLYRWLICPIRSHASITCELINNFKISSKINYTTFQNIKRDYNKLTINNKTKIEILDNIQYLEENLMKLKLSFYDKKNKFNEIRIFATNEMLNNLADKNVNQYFMDGTYKIVPNIGNFATLVTLLGYNKIKNTFVQCCFSLLTDETQNT